MQEVIREERVSSLNKGVVKGMSSTTSDAR